MVEEPEKAETDFDRGEKTAVLLIHGMGEQRPMESLWGFVEALWISDKGMVDERRSGVYSKPDEVTGNFELRRITTRPWKGAGSRRVDFFEFYWAHLMTGNTVRHLLVWLGSLIIRRPSSVPARLFPAWIVLWLLLLTALGLSGLAALPGELRPTWISGDAWPWLLGVAGVLTIAQGVWVAPVAGDAARYLSATPDNVEARSKIRDAGLKILKELHECGEYDRVIVVGHSLGTVIGYDILNFYWSRLTREKLEALHPAGSTAMDALEALEVAAGELIEQKGTKEPGEYRAAQRSYFHEISKPDADGNCPWLVSDFVTLGSPLSKAEVLLANDKNAFERKKSLREVPSCPPWLEKLKPPRMSYPFTKKSRIPHHACAFGPTVLTNVYFNNALIVFGDIIAGPVAPLLGPGVVDVPLKIGAPVFRHLDYWKYPTADPPPQWVVELRKAVNLRMT